MLGWRWKDRTKRYGPLTKNVWPFIKLMQMAMPMRVLPGTTTCRVEQRSRKDKLTNRAAAPKQVAQRGEFTIGQLSCTTFPECQATRTSLNIMMHLPMMQAPSRAPTCDGQSAGAQQGQLVHAW